MAGDNFEAAMAGGVELVTGAGFTVDYFEVRHAQTLAPVASVSDGPLRILVAAKNRKDPPDRQYRGLAGRRAWWNHRREKTRARLRSAIVALLRIKYPGDGFGLRELPAWAHPTNDENF